MNKDAFKKHIRYITRYHW